MANILEKDIGGLPVGVWAAVVIGGVAIGWFLLSRPTVASGTPTVTGTSGSQNIPQIGVVGPPGPQGPPGSGGITGNIQIASTVTFGQVASYLGVSQNRLIDLNRAKYPIIATFQSDTVVPQGWLLQYLQ